MKTGLWLKLALAALLVLGYPLGMHWLLTASSWSHEALAWFSLAQNVGMQLLLALFFGLTLLPGREPLIARFARRIHGADYSPRIACYARAATWAWTLFFATMVLTPIVLFAWTTVDVFSFFVNVLSLPLLGAMFVAEYAARRWCLRGIAHVPLARSFTLYREERAAAEAHPVSKH
ncbi:MAG: hypothetical protein VW475_13660 [Curvibacter sp.]